MWPLDLSRKRNKLQGYCTTDFLKIFHLHFSSLIMIQIFGNNAILAKETSRSLRASVVENFLMSILDLKQIWKIVPRQLLENLNSFRKSLCLYFNQNLVRGFGVIKYGRVLGFKGERGGFRVNWHRLSFRRETGGRLSLLRFSFISWSSKFVSHSTTYDATGIQRSLY